MPEETRIVTRRLREFPDDSWTMERVLDDGLVVLDHAVHDLVDRPVSSDGYEEADVARQGVASQLGCVSRVLRDGNVVLEAPVLQSGAHGGQRLRHTPATGARVADQQHPAER